MIPPLAIEPWEEEPALLCLALDEVENIIFMEFREEVQTAKCNTNSYQDYNKKIAVAWNNYEKKIIKHRRQLRKMQILETVN